MKGILSMQHEENQGPLVGDKQSLPEITLKAIVLSVILTVILSMANAFLGLKVGITISASIPAAIMSMGVLRFFKNSNVLENNIVQTAASAGEALTAGIIFTIPALIVLHFWQEFNYLVTVLIAIIGGIIGVLFTIPLRRVLLEEKSLHFPEGTAIGNILKVSVDKAMGLGDMLWGSFYGAVISLCQTGFKILNSGAQIWVAKGDLVLGAAVGFAPSLIGAGYIIGINTAMTILLGVILGWIVGVPVTSLVYGIPTDVTHHVDMAMTMWKEHIRFIGLGVMIVGGLWAVIILFKPMIKGIAASLISVSTMREQGHAAIPRTERDIPITVVAWGTALLMIPSFFILQHFVSNEQLAFSTAVVQGISWLSLFYLVIGGFAFASICAYFAGLVGSSTNPLSSMALISLIISSLLILMFLGHKVSLHGQNPEAIAAAALAIIITSFICSAAAISNDTIQDLKAGQMVGATPWKQQLMLVVGVIISAVCIPPVLNLLFYAYGIGGVFPRAGMDPSQMLAAPQAGLMAAVVNGIFTGDMNWLMLMIGGIIAVITLIADKLLEPRGIRIPVLAIGLGIYLPIITTTPLIIGGLLSYVVNRKLDKQAVNMEEDEKKEFLKKRRQRALLLACGLVAGAAVMGVLLAIPFAIQGSSDGLRIIPDHFEKLTELLGMAVTFILCYWIYRRVCKS
jgi:putative OPT family oligopeptide transporter